jgi:hypothetical protein
VIEIRRRLGLGVEPPDVRLIGELPGEDHLQRHGAVEADLPRQEDDAHATACQFADDLVVAEIPETWRRGIDGSRRRR